jgi:succinyl-diaminopimelate desuccinylase
VCAVAKGAIRLRLELTGAMAHGAMPQHARNPVTVAAEIVGALADVEAGLRSEYGTHEHLGPAYVTPTVLLAGDTDQINVIPGRATLCLDVRTVPGVDHEALVREVGAVARCGGRAGTGRRRGRRRGRPAAGGHGAGPPGRGRGGRGARGGDGLATDVRRGCRARPTARSWPATPDSRPSSTGRVASGSPHQADEFVAVADVLVATRVYVEAARRFLNGSGAVSDRRTGRRTRWSTSSACASGTCSASTRDG